MSTDWYVIVIYTLIVLLVFFLLENYRSNYVLTVKKYNICSDKIPESFCGKKIVFLSDLHNNRHGENHRHLLRKIEKENPDYVFVGGDMIVCRKKFCSTEAEDFMKELCSRYPVFCANGNHEERLRWQEAMGRVESGVIYKNYISNLVEYGAIHLDDKTIELKSGEDKIMLSGLCIDRKYYKKLRHVPMKPEVIAEKIGKPDEKTFHILMAHNPDYFETYVKWGADLTLSGHVHGGIMRLPVLGGMLSPAYEIFPKYHAGLYEKDEKRMLVSTGLGCHSIKIRIFNPPQIVSVVLDKKRNHKS